MNRVLIATAAIVSCNFLLGCAGEKKIETVPIFGEVKRMSGEPVGNVTVVFYPKAGPVFTTKADSGGKFNAKVPPGENRVAVISGGSVTSTDTSPEALEKAKQGDEKLDPRFASPDTSGFTVNAKANQTEKVVLVVEAPAQQ